MGDHVFVSYARENEDYARSLVTFLWRNGIDAWIDAGVEHSDQWRAMITEKVDTCAALIVIMTPSADQSEWVEKEIVRAEQGNKPILPLLLEGAPIMRVNTLQYENVIGGRMPGATFLDRLRRLMWAGGAAPPGVEEPWRVRLLLDEQIRTARGAMAEVARSRAERVEGRGNDRTYGATMLIMAAFGIVIAVPAVTNTNAKNSESDLYNNLIGVSIASDLMQRTDLTHDQRVQALQDRLVAMVGSNGQYFVETADGHLSHP